MFNWWSWHASMIWSSQEVLRWSRISLSRFRKNSLSSTSTSSLQRTPLSSWEDQSKDSRMATSPWSFLRSSLTICSRSSRSLERSPRQVSSFRFFQKIRRFNVIVSFIRSSDQRLENCCGWLSSGMTSSIQSKNCQGHSSIPKIKMSEILFISSSMSTRQETSSLSWSPQLPVRNQDGKFPVQISSYSDSDWAGCQKSRKSTSGSLISVFNINLQSTSRTQASIAHSSAESELYAMTQASVESLAIKNFIQEFNSPILSSQISIVIQTDSSAGKSMASRLGISRRSKHIELKYLWIQDEIKEGKLELKKVGTHFNPSDILTKYAPASVLGQHLPRLNIFKVPFQKSKSVLLSAHTGQSVQCSSHPQPPSTSTSSRSTTPLSVFMFSVNFDHQEHLRQRLRQASRSIKRVLTPPRRGSGDQESNALRRQHVSQQESDVQENQDSEVRDSDSSAHGQQHVPPQNQESTSQWSSWVRLCFSVSVSLRSLSWRRQGQERNQENQEHQEGINQRLSHLYLCASRVMSYVLFYSVFCGFVIFLFNSLHPSNQPSVQKSSAQPFVTEAVFDSRSESEFIASASFASLQSVTSSLSSVIMALSSAIKSAHDAASTLAGQPQVSDDVVMLSADPILIVNNHHSEAIESAEIRTASQCQGSRSVQRQIPHHHWSNTRSLHHFHQRGWTCVICQMMSRCSHHASKLVQTRSTSSSSWTQKLNVTGSSSMMQSSSSGISIMFFKFLESRIHQEVTSSTGSFISHFRMPSIT